MKRLILVVSAVAVAILAVDKIGAYEVVPGDNSGFQFERLPNPGAYALGHENEGGDLTAWIRLVVQSNGVPIKIAPAGWTGPALTIVSNPLNNGTSEVLISKKPSPPYGTPFLWGAGIKLRIVETKGTKFEILDWTVYPSNQAVDSQALARRRHLWTRISLGLLPLSLLGVAVGALPAKESARPVTARVLIETIVNDIAGKDGKETSLLRKFLGKVLLEDVPVSESLAHVGFRDTTPQERIARFQFLTRATALLKTRVDNAISELGRYSSRL